MIFQLHKGSPSDGWQGGRESSCVIEKCVLHGATMEKGSFFHTLLPMEVQITMARQQKECFSKLEGVFGSPEHSSKQKKSRKG